jgi:hypothetical protein
MVSKEKGLDPVELHSKEKVDDRGHQHSSDENTSFIHANWYFKVIALITAMMLSAGGHFSASAISAMKTTVKSVSNDRTDGVRRLNLIEPFFLLLFFCHSFFFCHESNFTLTIQDMAFYLRPSLLSTL